MTLESRRRRVMVIGLDCAEPSLVFDRWRDDLPHLSGLMNRGVYGKLESVIPCITVPAWASMMSSRDPGQLGVYGFHNRAGYDYEPMSVASAASIRAPMVWDLLDDSERKVVLIGVPPAYPPRRVPGVSVGCFLTPASARSYTYPAEVAEEIKQIAPDYATDVAHFRTDDKDYLLRQIYAMTESRFRVVREFMKSKPWDFFMWVEIGVDRMHHGFWKQHDPMHHGHDPASQYKNAIHDYYRYVDREIGAVLSELDREADEETVVWIVSDHGARRMDGGICINEWLVKEGYLSLLSQPETKRALHHRDIDWSKTRAWGAGGYYGRVFLNVEGREPLGVIPPGQYNAVRSEIASKLAALPGPDGASLGTRVFRPEEIYRDAHGIPPDLLVYFGDLDWRAVGTIGSGDIYTFENDTGPDDANHAQYGLFICADPASNQRGPIDAARLLDVAPTILTQLGISPPASMIGSVLPFAFNGHGS